MSDKKNINITYKPTKLITRELTAQIIDLYSEDIAKKTLEELTDLTDLQKKRIYNKYKENKQSILSNKSIEYIYNYLRKNE